MKFLLQNFNNRDLKTSIVLFIFIALMISYFAYLRSLKTNSNKLTTILVESQDKEYVNTRTYLFSIVIKQDPKKALLTLDELIKRDKKIASSCHLLAHEVGHIAYVKYAGFKKALTYALPVCNSGYFHGVVEEALINQKDISASLQTLCSDVSENRCYHGIGHALMYFTYENLPRSLSLCDSSYENETTRQYCYDGVFMDNFNTDSKLHPSHYLNPNDPFYPCSSQNAHYKKSCYYYSTYYYATLHHGDLSSGLAWCETSEKGYAYSCARGIGAQSLILSFQNPKLAEKLCLNNNKPLQAECIDGMVGFYLDNLASFNQGKLFCNTLTQENQTTCLASVNARDSFLK